LYGVRINPRDFAKKRPGGNAPIMVNVRLRRSKRFPKPTAHDVRLALQHILSTGTVPSGWQFAAVNWRHPSSAHSEWRGPGDEVDLQKFGAVIQSELHRARIAVVRDTDEGELE
jgi:hypothetical protein